MKPCQRCAAPIVSPSRARYCGDHCRLSAKRERRALVLASHIASPTKECSRCGQVKPKAAFGNDARRPDGLFPYCRDCRTIYTGSKKARQTRLTAERRAELKRDRERHRLAAMSAEERSAKSRRNRLWRMFGLTLEQYEALLTAQGGVCAICRQPERRSSSKYGNDGWLAVDHDHGCCPGDGSCGRCIRGLLCFLCNSAIGSLGDDPERIFAAALYVSERGSHSVTAAA